MRKVRIVALALVAAIFMTAYGLFTCSSLAVALRIPSTAKQGVLLAFDQSRHEAPRWRGYFSQSSSALVVFESHLSVTSYPSPAEFFFMTLENDQVTGSFSFFSDGGKFQARAANGPRILASGTGQSTTQSAPDHCVYGAALDRRIVLVRVATADGRTAEIRPFDGFWWLQSETNHASFREDRWVEAVALDSSGRVLYQQVPEYPAMPDGR